MDNTVGTLKELDVKPGDVVEYVPSGNKTTVTYIFGDQYYGDGENSEQPYTDRPLFRVVSRASAGHHKLWKDMTPEEKGALLLAHHEGKIIQFWYSGMKGWTDNAGHPPNWFKDTAYRVKPEPVVETVTLFGQAGFCWAFSHLQENDGDTHHITFDLIDGKPDCNSIKMEEI